MRASVEENVLANRRGAQVGGSWRMDRAVARVLESAKLSHLERNVTGIATANAGVSARLVILFLRFATGIATPNSNQSVAWAE